MLYITGDGLKTLDAVASRIERVDVAPTVASFEEAVGESPPRRLNGPPHPRRHRMPVTVRIPAPLRPVTGGAASCSARRAPSAS